MADSLGVRSFDSSSDDLFARRTSIAIQSLGAQLRADMTSIAANREVRVLGDALRQLDPKSDEFPTQLMSAAISSPLGAQHPVGQMAILTLGAQHKAWEADNRADTRMASQEKLRLITANRPMNVPNNSAGLYRPVTDEFKTRKDLGLPELPTMETPAEKEERAKRLIEFREKVKRGNLRAVKNGDGTVAYFIDPVTGENFTPDELGAPETTPKPPLAATPRKTTPGDLKLLNELTDKMLAKQAELEKEKAKGKPTFGIGGTDNEDVKRLEAELAEAQKRVKQATSELGIGEKMALAEKALNHPNATEEHKAAAAKILGVKRPLTKEAVAAAINEVGNDQAKIKALLEQRGYAVD